MAVRTRNNSQQKSSKGLSSHVLQDQTICSSHTARKGSRPQNTSTSRAGSHSGTLRLETALGQGRRAVDAGQGRPLNKGTAISCVSTAKETKENIQKTLLQRKQRKSAEAEPVPTRPRGNSINYQCNCILNQQKQIQASCHCSRESTS